MAGAGPTRVEAGVDLQRVDVAYPSLPARIVTLSDGGGGGGAEGGARLSGATGGRILVATAPCARGDVLFEEVASVWCSRATRASLCDATAAAAAAFTGGLQWVAPPAAVRQLAPECMAAGAPAGAVGAGTAAAARLFATLLAGAGKPALPPGDERSAVLHALLLKLLFDANSFAAHVPLDGAGAGAGAGGAGAVAPPLAPGTAVGLLVAMMNHSCCPNVAHVWRWDSAARAPVVTVLAVRGIAAGEELCTRYLDVDTAPKHVRRKTLRERYGFTCQCVRCAAPVDDAMAFRCASCPDGAILGWRNTCTACGAVADLAGDELVEERAAVLTALAPPPPPPPAAGATVAPRGDGSSDGADGAGDAAADVAAAAALDAVLSLLAARDAAAHGLLRRRAIQRLRDGEVAGALADARAASTAVAAMPFLSPATALATHLLFADAAVAGGDIADACAAYAVAADLEAALCHPLRARYHLPRTLPPLAAALRTLVEHPLAPGLPSLRAIQRSRAPGGGEEPAAKTE